ncbi:MAG TPA: hypothetical protein VNT75_07975 [Symbiobacteriaceae bacterium]|nr:hypothetical protein [Symbiobacteriaceae bacterium]
MREPEGRSPRRGAKVIGDPGTHVIIHSLEGKLPKARRRSAGTIHEGMTFKDLRHFLTRHGFEPIQSEGAHKAFREAASGAMVVLPDYKDTDEIRPFHLASVRKLLAETGLADDEHPQRNTR